MDRSQHAYTSGKSAGDVVLAHKFLIAGSLEHDFEPTIVGIDMSKAFDTVNRQKLVTFLSEVIDSKGDINVIKFLMSNTTLAVKTGKSTSSSFETNMGVPQGDCLSPKLFTFYLDRALKHLPVEQDYHDYAVSLDLPMCISYADDVDFFITDPTCSPKQLVETVKQVFESFNLVVNDGKTEIVEIKYKADLSRVKKLGSFMDVETDINRREQLANWALSKYNFVWKNPFIKLSKKVAIYNAYVRSVFLYNCSTWHSNKGISDKVDIIHRKQLRRVLNIRYPKVISNERLYKVCKCGELSNFVQERRKRHLGHVLRRDTTAKDVLKYVKTLPERRRRGAKPANLFKTYRIDFDTDIPETLEELAFARKF